MDSFVARMERDLVQRYPGETPQIGLTWLREFIRAGIRRAKRHGIADENDLKRYLEYLMRFGADFGESAQTRWARPFLIDDHLNFGASEE